MRTASIVVAGVLLLACDKKDKPDLPEGRAQGSETGAGDERPDQEQLVDLYGDPLPDGAIARLGSIRMLDRALGRLIFSADGSEIISSSDGAYLIWQTTTAQRTGTLVRENGAHVLAMSPGGKVLATSIYGGSIQLWDYPARAAAAVIEAHRREVTGLCFIDDKTLASGSEDRAVKIFELSAKEVAEKRTLRGEWAAISALACAPNGAVAFADSDGKVLVAPPGGGDPVPLGEAAADVLDVAISADGARVAAAVDDGSVAIWKVKSPGKPTTIASAHARRVLTVAFDTRGKLMTSGGDRFFRVWDPASGEKLSERAAASDVDTQLFVLSPDGNFVAAFSELRDGRASEAGRFWLYDSASGKQLLEPDRHDEPLTAVAFTADGKKIITASEDRRVLLWDAVTASLLDTLATHQGAVRDLAVAGDVVFSAGDDARMHRSSLGGKDSIILEPIGGAVHAFARAPDGSRFVTGDFVGKVSSFSKKSGAAIASHAEGDFEQVHDLAFSPDGRYFAIAGASPEIHIVSATSGKKLIALTPDGPRSNHALGFSPDGKVLATGGDDHLVRLWGTSSWSELGKLEGSDGTVRALVFSPSGKRLAAGSSDETARVWDVGSGDPVIMLAGHRGAVTGVAFSPDGSRLATASRDETALIWQLPAEAAPEATPETTINKTDAKEAPPEEPARK